MLLQLEIEDDFDKLGVKQPAFVPDLLALG